MGERGVVGAGGLTTTSESGDMGAKRGKKDKEYYGLIKDPV